VIGSDDGAHGRLDVIRVVVAAPGVALRAGLRTLLAADDEIDVVGEAVSPAEAHQAHPPADVLVLAGAGPDSAGYSDSFRERISTGGAPLAILLLVGDDPQLARLAIPRGGGAWGLLPVDCSAEELLAAVKALHQGLLVGDPSLLEPLLSLSAEKVEQDGVDALTEREVQVLELLAQGLANKQIAAALGISEHTVKFHVSAIYSKLGANSRTEAVRLGVRQGLIVL